MTELKKAATAYANIIAQSENRKSYCKEDFIAGAQWQAEQSPWISVEERFPEKKCLCLTKGFAYSVLWYRGGKFYSVLEGGYEISIGSITHWCPIPE